MWSEKKKGNRISADVTDEEIKKRLERRMFRLFTASLTVVLDFLILQDKQNICSLSLNIKLICTRSKTLIEKLAMACFSICYLSWYK